MVSASNCLSPIASRRIAIAAVKELKDTELGKRFNIPDEVSNGPAYDDFIYALSTYAEIVLKDSNMSDDGLVDALIDELKKQTYSVEDSDFDSNEEDFQKNTKEYGVITAYYPESVAPTKEELENTRKTVEGPNRFVFPLYSRDENGRYIMVRNDDGVEKNIQRGYGVIYLAPKKISESRRDKTIAKLEKLRSLESSKKRLSTEYTYTVKKENSKEVEVKTEYFSKSSDIPEGARRTGNVQYLIDGEVVVARGARASMGLESMGDEFPVLSNPIGLVNDSVGRNVLGRRNLRKNDTNGLFTKLEDGTIERVTDTVRLQQFIDAYCNGLLSVQGLNNLIDDFIALESQLAEAFCINGETVEDLVFFTDSIPLLGRREGSTTIIKNKQGHLVRTPLYTLGYPDMLVIDKRGVVHVVDFKTKAVYTQNEYSMGAVLSHRYNNKRYNTGEEYSLQITNYIDILATGGLMVDPHPYVVLTDTYYNTKEKPSTKEEDKQYAQEHGKYVLKSKEEGKEGTPLGKYAEQNAVDSRNLSPTDHFVDGNERVVYIEPRLHVSTMEKNGNTVIDPSGKLDALAKLKPIRRETDNPYETEYSSLSEEDKGVIEDFGGGTVHFRVAKTAVKKNESDLDSNSDVLSTTEATALARIFMCEVYRALCDAADGDASMLIRLKLVTSNYYTAFKGKSHEEIAEKLGGMQNVLDTFFKHFYRLQDPGEDYSEEEYKEWVNAQLEKNPDEKFPTFEQYQQRRKEKLKSNHIASRKDQFLTAGQQKLFGLEKWLKPLKNTSPSGTEPEIEEPIPEEEARDDMGDNDAISDFIEKYADGIASLEAWMVGARHFSPRASLAQEVRALFESLYQVEDTPRVLNDGREIDIAIKDPYFHKFKMPIDVTTAIETILNETCNCETIEDMMMALERLKKAPGNRWINQLITALNKKGNENLKAKFFRHFRKDQLVYTTVRLKYNKETKQTELETYIVNKRSADEILKNSLGREFEDGIVGVFEMPDGKKRSLISRNSRSGKNYVDRYVADEIRKKAKKLFDAVSYNGSTGVLAQAGVNSGDSDAVREDKIVDWLLKNKIPEQVGELLHGVGILLPQRVITAACLSNIRNGAFSITYILSNVTQIVSKLQDQDRDDGEIPSGLKGLKAFRQYANFLKDITKFIPSQIEASCYEGGKTYYSYTMPSRLGHIVRNCKEQDPEKFKKYLQKEFKRYQGWFCSKNKDGETEWNNYMLELLDNSEKERSYIDHKVEVGFAGVPYKELGSLEFQLSLLQNYWGTEDDPSVTRWFGMPTMSNKPTNEFIRMHSLAVNEKGEPLGSDRTMSNVVEKVLMPTFRQECNRIADVLFQYVNGNTYNQEMDLRDENNEISSDDKLEGIISDKNAFVERVKSGNITREDLIALSKTRSGAKFHFLYYLNDDITNNVDFGKAVAARINTLLINDSDTEAKSAKKQAEREIKLGDSKKSLDDYLKKEVLPKDLEIIVNSELQQMRDIGLFDREKYYVTVEENGRSKREEQVRHKYRRYFGDKLGNVKGDVEEAEKAMEETLKNFILDDIAANINIIQLTGGDLAAYGNAVNYQKRIAQVHSPGLHLMHQEGIDDGFLRSIHISDYHALSEIKGIVKKLLNEKAAKDPDNIQLRATVDRIIKDIDGIDITDGQSYSSPSTMRKKLRLMGEWSNEMETAYKRILSGNYNINDLNVLMQPLKPFVTTDMPKYAGSPSMTLRKTTLQDKNSDYLLLIADAIARGAGKRSKLSAIFDFMEQVAQKSNGTVAIDTVHFASVAKVGLGKVIDLQYFDDNYNSIYEEAVKNDWEAVKETVDGKTAILSKDDAYSKLLADYMMDHISRYSEVVKRKGEEYANEKSWVQRKNIEDAENENTDIDSRERIYNNDYVDTIPIDDYIIQQEVPAHFLEDGGQLFGSQIRILGISDISDDATFKVRGESEELTKRELINKYQIYHEQNILAAYEELKKELGLDEVEKFNDMAEKFRKEHGNIGIHLIDSIMDLPIGSEIRSNVLEKLERILLRELSKDAKYGLDIRRSCTLRRDDEGNPIDFNVPLYEPIQSNRIQELLNSIIKKAINRQRINGGSLVQTTAYDNNLHIRFSDKDGKLLPTLDEYNKSLQKRGEQPVTIEDYIKQLQKEGASIAYYEAYTSVPDARLEALITKEDGSYMTPKEVKEKLGEKIWNELSEMIAYRIPTEDKYSMTPVKIVGFLPKGSGQAIMLPKEITYLTGADFDIDKLYAMRKSLDIITPNQLIEAVLKDNYIRANKKDKEARKQNLDNFVAEMVKMYNLALPEKTAEANTIASEKEIEKARKCIINGFKILNGEKALIKDGVSSDDEKTAKFAYWFRNFLLRNTFAEIEDIDHGNAIKNKQLRDNKIINILWSVLTNADTMPKLLDPGNFVAEKMVGRAIRAAKAGLIINGQPATYDSAIEYMKDHGIKAIDEMFASNGAHSIILPSSKIYFQRQNMQGSQLVGTMANHNVSHAFCSLHKIGINFRYHGERGDIPNAFYLDGHLLGDANNVSVLDAMYGFDGQLISKTIARFLAASVDTAKDPVLSDMNVNPFTASVAMTLVRLGYDTELVGLFLSQPIIEKLADVYFKNKNNLTDRYFDGNSAIGELIKELEWNNEDILVDDKMNKVSTSMSRKALKEGLSDTDLKSEGQRHVLAAFKMLLGLSKNVQDLTFCTKFNSATNAVGPTIADTEEIKSRVERYMEDSSKQESTYLYVPTFTNRGNFTHPNRIITDTPILKAFYETTMGENGASVSIFKHFFPHYFRGFKYMLKYFKDNYARNKKIDSTSYNKLLNAYVYFLLTYDNKEAGIYQTIPTNLNDESKGHNVLDYLVTGMVDRFKEIKQFKRSIPNNLLDEDLGKSYLRVRTADEYVKVDTLIFSSGGLSNDAKQDISDAWSDLVTMNDPALTKAENEKIRRFAIDLSFYMLMKNGFTFTPNGMMHLEPVVVKKNARFTDGFSSYTEGLQKLRDVDAYISRIYNFSMTDTPNDMAKRLCDQFVRNNSSNSRLVPNISSTSTIIDKHSRFENTILIKTPKKEAYKINFLKVSNDSKKVRPFICVSVGEGEKFYQELYRAVSNDVMEVGDEVAIEYKKIGKLGVANNFIEYNANDDIEESFFEDLAYSQIDPGDVEKIQEHYRDRYSDYQEVEAINKEENTLRYAVLRVLQTYDLDRYSRELLRRAIDDSENTTPLGKVWKGYKDALTEEEREKVEAQLQRQKENENKC